MSTTYYVKRDGARGRVRTADYSREKASKVRCFLRLPVDVQKEIEDLYVNTTTPLITITRTYQKKGYKVLTDYISEYMASIGKRRTPEQLCETQKTAVKLRAEMKAKEL